MPELRCDVQSCAHNKEQYCDLDRIQVQGDNAQVATDTSCASFVERTENGYSNSAKEASALSDVDCKAVECQYNCSCKCHAGKINVSGSDASHSEETECATFEKGN